MTLSRIWRMVLLAVAVLFAGGLLPLPAQTPPTISSFTNVTVYPGVSTPPIPFTISDAQTPAQQLTLSAQSSNTNLVPEANIVFGGSKENRTVTVTPLPNRSGTTVIAVTVMDLSDLTASADFTLLVEGFTALPPIGPPPLSTNHFIYDFAWLPAVDYDNDGDLDVPFKRLSQLTNPIYETFFLRNDGGGAFTPIEVGLTNNFINSVAWGDVDNDGWLDALIIGGSQVTNNSFSLTRLYRNSGGGFEVMPVSLPRFYNGIVSIADVNGDGLADLFLSGAKHENGYPQATVILLNDGSGGFAEWKTDLPVISAARVFWVDMDNDGDLDLLSEIQYSTRIFRNDTGGKFTEISAGLGEMSVVTAGNPMDVDNDGLTDVFMSGYYAGVVKRNQGNGTFSTWSVGLTNLAYGSAAVTADYNNDGWADIHLPIQGGANQLFHNNGNLTFSLADTNVPVGWCADLDGDGDLDVVANGILWRNNSAVANTPPTAPSNLAAISLPGDSVQLTWNRSTDAQTTNSTGLFYNLRLGTTPGGVEVLSPLSDLANGQRRVVGLGNASQTNRWLLRDLPRGTYYWSVQALDPAFVGSPFSTNGTFTVTRPQISEIADQETIPGFPLVIPFTISDVETPANSLGLAATSANTNLVALTSIVFGGSGTNRTVTLSPTPGLTGTNTISITVTDGNGFTDSTTFTLIVMPFLRFGNLTIDTWDNVFPADYNNDGLMDVLVSSDQVILWRNLGNGQFTNDATGLPMWHYGPGAWGDFDNDGWLDLALANLGRVYRNTGTNHFIVVTNGLFSDGNCCYKNVAWGDYDGDGWLDLVRVGDSASSTALLRNLGNGTFTNSGFAPAWGYTPALGWADLDNDGKPELLVSASKTFSDYNYDFTYIYRYNGGTNFTLVSSNALLTARFPTVGFRDFDADGDLDILIAGERSTGATCRVHRNDGNFNFTSLGNLTPNAGRNAAWGDYNNDGRPDILSYASQPSTVFVNLGNGSFTNIQANLNTVELFNGAWADFDNDGDLDVLSGKLYANLVPVSNQPPQSPAGLAANIVSNAVTLSWNAPLDDTTHANALTYAVRLGTNSGGSQILAADADPATGYRRAVPDVTPWPNRSRTVKDLPDGVHYWSVQAIDSGYAGSPFAPEVSFTYYHPTISGSSIVAVYPTATPPLVSFTVGDADSSADSLTLTPFSSNTNLLRAGNIVFGGAGSNRTATLNFTPGVVGTSVVSIVVTDLTGLTATHTLQFVSSYFTDVTPVFSGSNLFNPRWGDFDNDNDLDLYLGGTIYRNDGEMVFTAVGTVSSGHRRGVAWADYDNDGDLDLLSVAAGVGRIYRNDGNGVFTDINAGLQTVWCGAAAWGDFNNDGRPDVLLTGALNSNCDGPFTKLYRNDGNDMFSLVANTGLPTARNSSVVWGDVDSDGRLDVLINGLGSGPLTWFAEIYRNNGNGTFSPLGAGFTGGADGAADLGDYDNDGDLDALVTGFNQGTYVLRVYRNNGDGTFTPLTPTLQGSQYGDAQWVDFDNDGYLDIFVDGCIVNYCDASTAIIYRNNWDGTFSNANAGLNISAHSAYPVAWGDFDNDGDLDLFMDRLYRNNSIVSNSPPAAPTGVLAQLPGDNNVVLRWTPAFDAENTNAAGLSFAVRVGTAPGAADYVTPQADAGTGFRRVPQRGELSTNACLLRDVPRGTYYWSVQAIDAGFAGSPFSAEGSFTITNARPLISVIAEQTTVPGRATPPISFTVADLETDATNLAVSGYSLSPALVPNAGITFGGSGSNRTVTVVPVAGFSGMASILVAVTDGGGLSATSRFDVVVQMFTFVTNGLPVITVSGASAWADYDKDGDLDIALAGSGLSYTMIYRNTNGVFTNQNFNLPTRSLSDLAWLDFDNDGDADLTGIGWDGYLKTNFVYRNNFATNSFTAIGITTVTNVGDGAMAWGDYDNDGDPDLYLSGDPDTYHTPSAYGALYRNDRGVFTNSSVALPSVVRGAAAWGDFDNDGDLDLLIAGQVDSNISNSITKLFRNDSHGVFVEVPTALPPVTDCALAWGDFDHDGDLDVAIAGTGTNSVRLARVYRNLGGSLFTNLAASLTGVSQATVAWGDFDNDGYLDLVIGGSTNGNSSGALTRVYRNQNGVSFADAGGSLPGLYAHSASWGDYDGDGDLDLLLGSRVLRNNWNIPNTPPTAPAGLSVANSTNNALLFSWLPASDVEITNPMGLRYNLRLGTTPGGAQIVAAHADPATGQLGVPHFGNAGSVTFWPIRNLTNGTYYWSAQAIDGALSGSPFAEEQTFTISRPVFSVITNRTVLPNSAIAPIPFTVSDAETAASNLVLTVTSSDTNLVPQSGLSITGTGTNRVLTLALATNRSGTAIITLTATDEAGETGNTSFQLVVERFADINTGLSALAAGVAWGDYDNDGNLDLARGTTIYRNHENGIFTDLGLSLPSSTSAVAAWGDYDRDGDLDWLVHGSGFGGILRNDGNGMFTNVFPTLGGNPNSSLVWGDFDNDGDLDFLRAYSNATFPYRNVGSDLFTNLVAGLPIVYPGSVAWGDYDKDGDLDILMSGNGLLRVYRNNGNGTFTDLGAGLPGLYFASVAWGDFDNDGHLDFAVCGSTNNAVSGVVTRIYRNTTNATPTLMFVNLYPVPSQGPVGVWKGAVAWGDYDNDGDLDLIVSGETLMFNAVPFTRVYRNDNGMFTDSGHALPALRNSFAAWGDFGHDGHLDLALSGNLSNGTAVSRIYRNFPSGPPNVPPVAPAGLTNVVIGKSVRLSWAAASDANQSRGLSYNLRVGTAPGAGDIVSPMANGDGLRRLPAMGNANGRLSWTITNLTSGTFYWSVQAIDASFAGSPFAAERSFVVTNRPPVAIERSLILSEDTSLNLTLTGSDPDGDPLTIIVTEPPRFGALSCTPPNVNYRPQSNYFGFDQFKFVANDRTTNSAPATVFLQITPVPDVSEVTLGIETTVGGGMRLWLGGEPWHTYRLEASEDLVHWVGLTNVLSTNLLTALLDADAAQFSRRFYRAAWLRLEPEFGAELMKDSAGFGFAVVGEAGRNYRIESSANLLDWKAVAHVLLTNSAAWFVDPDAEEFSWQFYRIVAP